MGQAELDEWRKFRFRKTSSPKMQSSNENVDSVQEMRPEGNDTESFSEQGQRELDEWREFRKAHYPIPTNPVNPVKILNDLLDMGYPASEAPARVVEGVSAWKKKKGRKSGYRVKYV